MAKDLRNNPVVIRPDTTIGNMAAEEDNEFLFDCFVDHPAYSVARETNNSRMFITARTGGGKTAIAKMIEKQYQKTTSSVDLSDLSMNYVANSDIIRFLNSLDVDLDLFFQALWKHVLCLEFIRLRYGVQNKEASRNLFEWLRDIFSSDGRKQSALKYLEEWSNRFFITMDENIKEVTSKLESKVGLEFGAELHKFTTRAGYARTLSGEKRSEFVARAKKIVNASQLAELNRVLELLSTAHQSEKYAQQYYIIIDRLDEKWVDEEIRFDLIRALIECLRSFNKIPNLKIVVAIREDVIERVVQENQDAGFQREKYDDYFLRIVWSPEQLKELVAKRINSLYKRKYTSKDVHFDDIFKSKVAGKDPIDYIIERTLHRPRDVISFINECLERAQGATEVTQKIVKEAESEYSRIRMQALIHEWQSAFPSLEVAFRLLANRRGRFKSAEIAAKEFFDDFVLEVDQRITSRTDPIKKAVDAYLANGTEAAVMHTCRMLVSELYRIGAVGVKTSAGERYIYAYKDVPVINPETIDLETKVHLHPMLHRALNVQGEQVIEDIRGKRQPRIGR
ncbi:hypothetical protein NDN16_10530 [Aureimonas altamirensis]|uniref:P-loop ATPase, Sll1717 family n=1 Tax=Aureimonas altamirensis TaxID=370622 RepID=UPI002036ABD3|nr:P-loop NTPase fold protein [Aureimonas altamirensis]MCM2504107.1 hypothetical protein [Aureimonas altamirensis]